MGALGFGARGPALGEWHSAQRHPFILSLSKDPRARWPHNEAFDKLMLSGCGAA